MGVGVGRHEQSRVKYVIHHRGEIEDALWFLVHPLDRTPESHPCGEPDMIGTEKRAHEL